VQPYTVQTGFMDAGSDFGSSDVHFIKTPKVALLTGKNVSHIAAGEVWSFFDNELNYPISQLDADDLSDINLSGYDVIIMPDGSYEVLNDKDAASKLENFVQGGGKLIATESGAEKLTAFNWSGLKLIQDTSKSPDSIIQKNYGASERDFLTSFIPGAIYKVQLDTTHPVAYGYPGFYYTFKAGFTPVCLYKRRMECGHSTFKRLYSRLCRQQVKNSIKARRGNWCETLWQGRYHYF
jgi:hypothetical protein